MNLIRDHNNTANTHICPSIVWSSNPSFMMSLPGSPSAAVNLWWLVQGSVSNFKSTSNLCGKLDAISMYLDYRIMLFIPLYQYEVEPITLDCVLLSKIKTGCSIPNFCTSSFTINHLVAIALPMMDTALIEVI